MNLVNVEALAHLEHIGSYKCVNYDGHNIQCTGRAVILVVNNFSQYLAIEASIEKARKFLNVKLISDMKGLSLDVLNPKNELTRNESSSDELTYMTCI